MTKDKMTTIKDGMKIINNQKGRFAIWQMDDYKIINVEPTDKKYGRWVVVKNDKIIYVETHLTKAKKHIRWLGIFDHDESLITFSEDKSLYRKLELGLKMMNLCNCTLQIYKSFLGKCQESRG